MRPSEKATKSSGSCIRVLYRRRQRPLRRDQGEPTIAYRRAYAEEAREATGPGAEELVSQEGGGDQQQAAEDGVDKPGHPAGDARREQQGPTRRIHAAPVAQPGPAAEHAEELEELWRRGQRQDERSLRKDSCLEDGGDLVVDAWEAAQEEPARRGA